MRVKSEFQNLWQSKIRAANLGVVSRTLATPHRTVRHWHDGTRPTPGIAIAALKMWREILLLRKTLDQICKTVDLSDENQSGALARIARLLADERLERTNLDANNDQT